MDANPIPGHEEGVMPGLVQATTSIEEHSRRQRLMRRARNFLFAVALVILALELGLRLFGTRSAAYAETSPPALLALSQAGLFQSLDEDSGRYGLRPGFEESVEGIAYSISKHGTRGPDFERAKPQGERRILVVGDALAMGLGVPFTQSLGVRLAAGANLAEQVAQSAIQWRAINLGVPGYHAGQQVADMLARGRDFDPDLVLIHCDSNSEAPHGLFLDSSGGLQVDRLPLPIGLRKILWNSHLYGWIVSGFQRAMESKINQSEPMHQSWQHGIGEAETRAHQQSIADYCEANGIGFAIVGRDQDPEELGRSLRAAGILP